jgi:uncharacterized membrane protein YeiH
VETLVVALDLFGTFVFALSGAMVGVRHRLDLFGVLVLSYAAATAGGITRDLLIGAVPPASVGDWRYIVVPVITGLATFRWHSMVQRWRSPVLIFDAAGLALFAVAGTLKALAFGLNPLAALLLGILTGIGGGMVRDLLVAEVPNVLHAELYAVASLPTKPAAGGTPATLNAPIANAAPTRAPCTPVARKSSVLLVELSTAYRTAVAYPTGPPTASATRM